MRKRGKFAQAKVKCATLPLHSCVDPFVAAVPAHAPAKPSRAYITRVACARHQVLHGRPLSATRLTGRHLKRPPSCCTRCCYMCWPLQALSVRCSPLAGKREVLVCLTGPVVRSRALPTDTAVSCTLSQQCHISERWLCSSRLHACRCWSGPTGWCSMERGAAGASRQLITSMCLSQLHTDQTFKDVIVSEWCAAAFAAREATSDAAKVSSMTNACEACEWGVRSLEDFIADPSHQSTLVRHLHAARVVFARSSRC